MNRYMLAAISLAAACWVQGGCIESLYRPNSPRTASAYPEPSIEPDYAGEQVKDYTNRLRQIWHKDDQSVSQPVAMPMKSAMVPLIPVDISAQSGPGGRGAFAPNATTRSVSIPPPSPSVLAEPPEQPEVSAKPAPVRPGQGPRVENSTMPTPQAVTEFLAAMESQVAENPNDLQLQLKMRFYLLAAGQDDKALEPIPAFSEEENAEIADLLQMMLSVRDQRHGKPTSEQAAKRLMALKTLERDLVRFADLQIPKVVLCTRVNGFGVYDEIPSYTFVTGRSYTIIVYWELRHFTVNANSAGEYKTMLNVRLALHDGQGRIVHNKADPGVQDVSSNRRNDFYLQSTFSLPRTLPAGQYTLKVTTEDPIGNKVATAVAQPIVLKEMD
ncbi:MAG: hypothetical protein HQ546_04355 [Planctomycetes bacterium]|nr:hypothetical protein [Planctomycetota bacterium]